MKLAFLYVNFVKAFFQQNNLIFFLIHRSVSEESSENCYCGVFGGKKLKKVNNKHVRETEKDVQKHEGKNVLHK